MKRGKTKLFIIVTVLLLSMTIGFAIVSTNLNITGDILIKSQTWDIYFSNVRLAENSIEAESLNIDQNIPTQVNYTVNLNYGEKFEFLVDANNRGTLTALIGTISNDLLEYSDSITYNITYLNGSDVAIDQPLYKDNLETYKVSISYTGTDAGTLNITSSFIINYVYGKIELATASYSLVGRVYDQEKNLLTGGQVVIDDIVYQIDSNGSYIINNLTSGEHIIEIKDQNGNLIMSDTFTIQSGSENSIVDNIITSLSYLGMNANILITDTEVLFSSSTSTCKYDAGHTWEFAYTGDSKDFVVPCTGTYKIELWGAQGGSYSTSLLGGKAAYTSGEIELTEETNLYVYVGGQGGSENAVTNVGGYNGGGYSGNNSGGKSMGGGGATDIRLIGGEWNNFESLKSRIMVAAGGGGTVYTSSYSVTAGYGGSLIGGSGGGSYSYNDPAGGTQTAGGGNTLEGKTGSFGYAPQTNVNGWGGGGGSGYFAGATGNGKGGAGGSSFVSGCIGCSALTELSTSTSITFSGNVHYSNMKFYGINMLDGFIAMPSPTEQTYEVGHSGDGYAKITLLKADSDGVHNVYKLKCAVGESVQIDYTGEYATFNSMCDATYKIELWGAQGGTYNASYVGGKGAYTSGDISLNYGEELYIYVGGEGVSENANVNMGGYNGGGMSGNHTSGISMGGGGATDVRLISGSWDKEDGLKSRIMVAAGGGGTGYNSSYSSISGYGGDLIGGTGGGSYNATSPTGGTQTSAGVGKDSNYNGYFGYGRKFPTTGYGGGGGSGYYAGANGFGKGGAGGSSFISGYEGCDAIDINGNHTGSSIHYSGKLFTNGQMIAGNATMPTHDGTSTMTGNEGNGHAKITIVSLN